MVVVPSALVVKLDHEKSKSWILDSACTSPIANRRDYFHTSIECNGTIQVGVNECFQSYGSGTVKIETVVYGVTHNVPLNDVLCAPKFV